ncbi:zinc finger protein 616-like [Oppia nitens]|uniref:zinc finger protein 616-like n=1 Tax=Oppia nitens TaxID=1686743 RepID=UPI0023DC21F0|nr:zinc finger protein 616-like [Oppia nitens]
MNQSNDNIRHTRLGRYKRQDMIVTIDVNDVFEEVVKQNERLVKEIEFYEEVVNDLITNVKKCIVCQQNDVIKDRISELETHLKSKTIDNSSNVKSDDNDCDNNLKTNLKTKKLQKSKKSCVKEIIDSDTSDYDNESDRSWTTNANIKKTSMKSNKRNDKIIIRDVNEVEDNKSNYNKTEKHIKSKKTKKNLKRKDKIILRNVDKIKDNNNKVIKSGKRMKLYSNEYQEKRQKLKDDTLTGDGSYQCQTCDYKSIKFPDFETHVNRLHLNIKPYKCHICSEHFVGYDSLRKHKSRKHYYVGQGLDQLSDKRKSQIAETLSKFQCQYCQKFLHCKSELKRHVLHVHHNVKPTKTIACDMCDKSYRNSCSLVIHKRLHHSIGPKLPYYYCDWEGCQFKTTNKCMVSVHKKSKHLVIRDIMCDWPGCDFRTATKTNLNKHKFIHSDVYDYRCQWPGCEYQAKYVERLKKHMERVHEDIPRTMKCHWPGCDKTFKFAYSLTKHMKIHNKPHLPCPHCNKLFTTKEYLNLHVATHTGSLRVICPIKGCNIEISSKNNIRHHMRVHHKNCTGN